MRFPPLAAPALLAALAPLVPTAARAQEQPVAPVVLLLPAGARGAAMADALLGARDDEALAYSPGQLAVARGASASWRHAGGSDLRAVAAAFQAGSLGIAVGARQLDFDAAAIPFPLRALGAAGGRPASSVALTAGAGRTVKGVRVGAALSHGEDRLGDTRIARTTADVGAARTVGPAVLALAVQHLGGSSDVAGAAVRSPTRVTLGANADGPLGPFDVAGGAALSVERGGRVVPRTGWEVGWSWLEGYTLQARAGLRRPAFDGQSAVTLGAGFTRDNVSLDWAFEPAGDLPASHRIGLRVR